MPSQERNTPTGTHIIEGVKTHHPIPWLGKQIYAKYGYIV